MEHDTAGVTLSDIVEFFLKEEKLPFEIRDGSIVDEEGNTRALLWEDGDGPGKYTCSYVSVYNKPSNGYSTDISDRRLLIAATLPDFFERLKAELLREYA